MRTVEQLIGDLKKAREATATAKKAEDKLVAELQEIYNSARNALGISEVDPLAFK